MFRVSVVPIRRSECDSFSMTRDRTIRKIKIMHKIYVDLQILSL